MQIYAFKKIGLLILILSLAACASNKPASVATKTVVRTIAVLPVQDPEWFSLENRNPARVLVPLIGVANKLDSRDKAKLFTEAMVKQKTPLARNLTETFVNALNARGYRAYVLLDDVKGLANEHEEIDFTKLKDKADAVLSASIYEIGVYAGDMSVDYLPNISIYGSVISTTDGEYLYDETLYYGVNARENVSWGILADPKFAYSSFESLIKDTEEVGKKFDFGTQELGKRMAEHIHEAL